MIKVNTRIICCFLGAVFFSATVFGDVKLPSIFSDKLVLQQRASVAIWGWAYPGEQISIRGSWSEKSATIIADEKGNWKGKLQTPAAGGPYSIEITGKNSIELKDVLIGEVWICSGQSNMVFKLRASEHAKAEIAVANLTMIRYFDVKRQYGPGIFSDAVGSVWQTTTSQNASSFSAVAYYFAKKINNE
ncbi:MAG: sialate O-acetylesterase, partial [Ferruginibacter sp.]